MTPRDFYQEIFLLPMLAVLLTINQVGAAMNRRRAAAWLAARLPLLEAEFAHVGFTGGAGAAGDNAAPREVLAGGPLLRQNTNHEFVAYATGRQNVASLDLKLTLYKRHTPFLWLLEVVLAFFFESVAAPVEKMEATASVFDGKEKALAPDVAGPTPSSAYDGFVFAIVHKDRMKKLRADRYDLSLTTTREHEKLPDWASVMSENAEITDSLLTPELLAAVHECGEDLDALIISDQPTDAPETYVPAPLSHRPPSLTMHRVRSLDDLVPKKRVYLCMRLSDAAHAQALFEVFLRLPDRLVDTAHFRAEALRKVRATREDAARRLRKVQEDERAEERRTQAEKSKKEERERKLNNMSAEEQKKFLAREKEAEQRKGAKKRSMRA